jgi:hypothetical protein
MIVRWLCDGAVGEDGHGEVPGVLVLPVAPPLAVSGSTINQRERATS